MAVIIVLVVFGMLSSTCSDATQQRAVEQQQNANARAAEQRRTDDSVRIMGLVGKGASGKDVVELDGLIHQNGFSLVHAAEHELAVGILIDSASRLMRVPNRSRGQLATAAGLMEGVHAPLTSRQQNDSTRVATLLAREYGKIAAAAVLEARKEYAKQYENRLLDESINATVTTRGKDATTLRLKWILVSRVLAHKMSQEPSFFDRLRQLGFKRFEITDGYDDTWYWDL